MLKKHMVSIIFAALFILGVVSYIVNGHFVYTIDFGLYPILQSSLMFLFPWMGLIIYLILILKMRNRKYLNKVFMLAILIFSLVTVVDVVRLRNFYQYEKTISKALLSENTNIIAVEKDGEVLFKGTCGYFFDKSYINY
ncbi:hypothetical protein [Anaerosphaera multitolerans]|uniref:Uncharacterized protein n=1 Tax=Anaerosphaera multitolerans TaxID=2487351 RepID=A0A437S6J4_9FIRM|nr:hypothetical protein [Anaerosphaera multitolerans]RVU54629.1 hypothetical protein EF514_06815 [Anaerosphaera multitolerans]